MLLLNHLTLSPRSLNYTINLHALLQYSLSHLLLHSILDTYQLTPQLLKPLLHCLALGATSHELLLATLDCMHYLLE
jgi:hypothetical protein